MEIQGRTFLVTGGDSGLGTATAEKLAGSNIVADLESGEVGDHFRFVETDEETEKNPYSLERSDLLGGGPTCRR